MRGLVVLGVLILGLGGVGWVLRKTRKDVASVLFGFCALLVVMLVAVLLFGGEPQG